MLRKIIKIDEDKCDGCGVCVPSCAEGALQIIDGKVRLISDLFCDGLGACIGECPQNALTIKEREAEPYDEKKVMEYIVKGGRNVIKAHLEHLREHKEFEYLRLAKEYLVENDIEIPELEEVKPETAQPAACGCPGSQTMEITPKESIGNDSGSRPSQLAQWPIQLHLVSPQAPYYQNSDLLLAADCAGFAHPDFHKDYLKGKSLAIACPKLDSNQEIYKQKITMMVNESNIRSIHVLMMQVPCCGGLFHLAQQAVEEAVRTVPIHATIIGVDGSILREVTV